MMILHLLWRNNLVIFFNLNAWMERSTSNSTLKDSRFQREVLLDRLFILICSIHKFTSVPWMYSRHSKRILLSTLSERILWRNYSQQKLMRRKFLPTFSLTVNTHSEQQIPDFIIKQTCLLSRGILSFIG